MPHKPSKKPSTPHRPFPWVCRECGDKAIEMMAVHYDAEVRHDGRVHTFKVDDLELPVCQSCKAKVFTEDTDRQINLAYRRHVGLLTPDQIRDAIARIDKTQTIVATRLGIAKETLSRWINEVQIQNKSMDTLLRIYFAFPFVRAALDDAARILELGLADASISRRSRAQRQRGNSNKVSNGWNGERDNCRPAQKLIMQKGSTWQGATA